MSKSRRPSAVRLCVEPLEERWVPATVPNRFWVTNVDPSGAGSLRQAILDANATANNSGGPDQILFDIPGAGPHVIKPLSELPVIDDPVAIEGYSQSGARAATATAPAALKIVLDGSQMSDDEEIPLELSGLTITAGSSTVRGLAIINFPGSGIELRGGGENRVFGNHIGTDVGGTADQGNGSSGVRISESPNNDIGGAIPERRNVISGNGGTGVSISGDTAGTGTAVGNRVRGNFIGTDATGTAELGNFNGIWVSANGTVIGGTVAGARNVISGNGRNAPVTTGYGIHISEGYQNRIEGNFIGTDVTGTRPVGNSFAGVLIINGESTTIGGTAPGAGNLISGNSCWGIFLQWNGAHTTVQGNTIGTDVTGTTALANGADGILVNGSDENTIGGTASGAANLISGNGGSGIHFSFVPGIGHPVRNHVEGNLIGTARNGHDALGNAGDGVRFDGGLYSTVGGAGAGNTIAFNGGAGVFVTEGSGISILSNSIHSNGGLGIDLGPVGVTANDPLDADPGPNELQNFPILDWVTNANGQTLVKGSLSSSAGATFRIQFFANAAPDPSGHGEGERFLGEMDVTTDANGAVAFTLPLNAAVTAGEFVTATATLLFNGTIPNGTSEFGPAVPVLGAIRGRLYHDIDADGVRDAGEPGQGTWQVYLDTNDNGRLDGGEVSVPTDASGEYTFGGLVAGSYNVREVLPPEWYQSAPGSSAGDKHVVAVAGQLVAGRDFGNYQPGLVGGTLYHDLDGDGVRDAGEPGLSQWIVYVDANNNGVRELGELFDDTDTNGDYEIAGLRPGPNILRAEGQPGWLQSAPAAGFHSVPVVSGQLTTGWNFGTYRPCVVVGTVFHDFDADGTRDPDETILRDWIVYADVNNNNVLDFGEPNAKADPTGRYVLQNVRPGAVIIREFVPGGWRVTTPAAGFYSLTLTSGQVTTGRDFGNTSIVPRLFVILSVPSVAENAGPGAVVVTVIRSGAPTTSPLTVTLSSSDTSEATVPASVVIPPNRGSVSFLINAVDDLIHDGTQSVLIQALAPAFASGSATLFVTDNEP